MLLDDFEDMISVMQYEYKPDVVRQYITAKLKEFGERLRRPSQKHEAWCPAYDETRGACECGAAANNARNAQLDADIDRELATLERKDV